MKKGWWRDLKLKLFRWMIVKVFKVPLGNTLPKPLRFLRIILFPLESHIIYNKWMKYEPDMDCFLLCGVRYSHQFFNLLGQLIKEENRIFKIRKYSGIVYLEDCTEETKLLQEIRT